MWFSPLPLLGPNSKLLARPADPSPSVDAEELPLPINDKGRRAAAFAVPEPEFGIGRRGDDGGFVDGEVGPEDDEGEAGEVFTLCPEETEADALRDPDSASIRGSGPLPFPAPAWATEVLGEDTEQLRAQPTCFQGECLHGATDMRTWKI